MQNNKNFHTFILCNDTNYNYLSVTREKCIRINPNTSDKSKTSENMPQLRSQCELIFDNYSEAKPYINILSTLYSLKVYGFNGRRLKSSLKTTYSNIESDLNSFKYHYQTFYLRMIGYINNWFKFIEHYDLSSNFLISTHEELVIGLKPKLENFKLGWCCPSRFGTR